MSILDLALSPRQSRQFLGDRSDLRQVGRRAPGAPWLPLLLFGGSTMLSAAVAAADWSVPLVFGLGLFAAAGFVGARERAA